MKRSGMLLILLGLAVALMSGLGVVSVLNKQTAPTPTPIPTVKVVVAAQNIPERTAIQATMLTVKDWPQDLAPVGSVSKPQDLVGKITAGPLSIGEPVLMSKVSTEPTAVGLAPTLPPGLVAVSLALSPVSAVAGAVREGDSIDIMISLEYINYNENGEESKPLHVTFYTIQDVPVLSVSGAGELSTSTSSSSGASVTRSQSTVNAPTMLTVLVTPQDALLLKYGREKGSIDVALRSPQFHDQVVTDPVFLDYIIGRFELPRPVLIRKQATSSTGEAE